MTEPSWFEPEFSGRLCLTLVHSLWQMGLLAAIGWLVEQRRGAKSLEWTHSMHVALLATGVMATAATYVWVEVPATVTTRAAVNASPLAADANIEVASPATPRAPHRVAANAAAEVSTRVSRDAVAVRGAANSADAPRPTPPPPAPPWLRLAPWAAGCYALGVLIMLARLALAMIHTRRVQLSATPIDAGPFPVIRDALVRRWSMRVVPALAVGRNLAVPVVVGLLRPTVLLPLAATTRLQVDEVELILAHELAHIRRHDLWVNLFQRLVETILFFNPGAWRLSRRISALREYCCDENAAELAVDGSSHRTRYAQALLRVAELHIARIKRGSRATAASAAALAATGRTPSELRRRIARLFGEPLREPLPVTRGGAVAIAAIVTALLTAPVLSPLAAESDGGRTLRFPADRAVGAIFTRPASAGGFGFRDDYYTGWKRAADARGDVQIPPGMQVRLDIAKSASADLSFLAALPPDAIDMLMTEGTGIADDQLQHIGQLTGLRFVEFEEARITDAGVQHLIGLKQLQTLRLSAFDVHEDGFGVGDDAMGVVAFLPALESIDLRLTKVTDEGMARLKFCKSLRSVSIPGTAVTDAGLRSLARLPRLMSLSLGVYDEGAAVGDEGMRTVGRMTKLRWLDLSGTKVSNKGLQRLAPLANLEELSIDETQITNDGLSALAPLTGLKSLRAYNLADGSINDVGATHVAKLLRLETIQTNMELTNKGAIAMAKAPRLEDLSLSGPAITDECCAAIAAMANLKSLWFQDCLITDAGLEQLSHNPTLEYLLIADAPITSEGLRRLTNLPKFKRLSIDMDVEEDRSPDDHHSLQPIGELAGLTDLDIDGFDAVEIRHLAPLKNLTRLEFGDKVVVDDAAMATIGDFPKLTSLTINASTATDAGLRALSDLTNLDYLQLSCVTTDGGLPALYGMKSLRMLQIASPFVTQAGLDRLAANMPALQEINKYNYRLLGDEVTPSAKDAFWRRGKPENRAPLDALEDKPPPPLDVARWVNVAKGDDLDDLTLADLRGKVVLVRFWGARISRTKREQPQIDALYKKYADQGFEIVGVHMTEYAEQFDAFIKHYKIAWPESIDREEHTAQAWKADYPAYFLIDRAGTLRLADVYRHHLDAAVAALISESPPEDASKADDGEESHSDDDAGTRATNAAPT
jgi:beta-lactamase regulating signal transducer with metallopeptidase domain/Leucine-rich repeat (LRR) protein